MGKRAHGAADSESAPESRAPGHVAGELQGLGLGAARHVPLVQLAPQQALARHRGKGLAHAGGIGDLGRRRREKG